MFAKIVYGPTGDERTNDDTAPRHKLTWLAKMCNLTNIFTNRFESSLDNTDSGTPQNSQSGQYVKELMSKLLTIQMF